MTKRGQWERIQAEWPELGEFLIAWQTSECEHHKHPDIKIPGGKMEKVHVINWPEKRNHA